MKTLMSLGFVTLLSFACFSSDKLNPHQEKLMQKLCHGNNQISNSKIEDSLKKMLNFQRQ